MSYSHADEGHLNELVKHLGLLRRQGLIEPWYDRQVEAGTNVHTEITDKLRSADVVLLLVSPDFVSSDYCYDREMQTAMERHRADSATVIPAILRPCDWHSAPFGNLMAVPKDGLAVTEHANRDRAYLEIAQAVRKAAEGAGAPYQHALDTGVSAARGPYQEERPSADRYTDGLRIRRDFTDWQKDELAQGSVRGNRAAFRRVAGAA